MLLMTKEEMREVECKNTVKLFDKYNGPSHVAKMLGINIETAHNWKKKLRVSIEGALRIGNHPIISKRISAEDLRPDIEHYIKQNPKYKQLNEDFKKLYNPHKYNNEENNTGDTE